MKSKENAVAIKKKEKYVSCLLCGKNDTYKISDITRYDIPATNVICKNCGLVYINPRQNQQEIKKYYRAEYRKQYDAVDIESEEYRKEKEDLAKDISLVAKKRGKVLEIGCANGVLLNEIKKARPDLNVFGVEPAVELAKKAKEKNKLNVFCGMLNEFETDKKFDFIVLNHVLEHFENPLAELKHIKKLLADDGLLFVAVPDIRRPYRDFEKCFLQSAHLYNFSSRTIKILFKLAGFQIFSSAQALIGIAFVLEKGEKYNSEDINFQEEGEDWRQMIKFFNIYKNKFYFEVCDDHQGKIYYLNKIMKQDINLEKNITSMYVNSLKKHIFNLIKRKEYNEAEKLIPRYFEYLGISFSDNIKMLKLAFKLAEAAGNEEKKQLYKNALSQLRKQVDNL